MKTRMRAMLLERPGSPLRLVDLRVPQPGSGAVLIEVEACGVCRTDLHLIDGELPHPLLPVIPGHEIVGRVVAIGQDVTGLQLGQRVGVPWLGWTCGACRFCTSGRENLCDAARFTGYQIHGGYAEYTLADARYCFPLPDEDPPTKLDAALIFAPVGQLVPIALRQLDKGGCVVCAGIHMSDIPAFPYALLWGERSVRSVANLTRRDGLEFLDLAPRVPMRTEVHRFPQTRANEALAQLRRGEFQGAAVLTMDGRSS